MLAESSVQDCVRSKSEKTWSADGFYKAAIEEVLLLAFRQAVAQAEKVVIMHFRLRLLLEKRSSLAGQEAIAETTFVAKKVSHS